MNQNKCNFYLFLKAARGNWHNALFVKCACDTCCYGNSAVCKGFLFIADADGTPLLMDAESIRKLTGEEIEPEDCQGIISRNAFLSACASYIEWHTEDDAGCPLQQLCRRCGKIC